MKLTEIKRVIKTDLEPRYNLARDSRINHTLKLLNEYETTINLYRVKKAELAFGEKSDEVTDLYCQVFGYPAMTNGRVIGRKDGLVHKITNKEYKLIFDMKQNAKQITTYFTKEYKETVRNLVEAIAREIKKTNPKAVEVGSSTEHDIHFVLTYNKKMNRSFTINTIVAGGLIQVIHNRTSRKLHKGEI